MSNLNKEIRCQDKNGTPFRFRTDLILNERGRIFCLDNNGRLYLNKVYTPWAESNPDELLWEITDPEDIKLVLDNI